MRRAGVIALIAMIAFSGTLAALESTLVPEGGWRSEQLSAHPLAGRTWKAAAGSGSFEDALCVDFLLLGEVHDNPDHHLIRAGLLAKRSCEGRACDHCGGAVVLEQIRADQAPALDAFASSGSRDPLELMRALDWDASGWPDAASYAPLFHAAIDGGLAVRAGDAARGMVRKVARGGIEALDAGERHRLRLDQPLDPDLGQSLSEEIAASHCGLLPETAIGGMAQAQGYRDAHLADAMISARQAHGPVVLMAGNGHVRSDRGVPFHLALRAPEASIASVMLIEVEAGKTDPEDYVPLDPDGKPAVDWIIFTPRAERPDPCEEMKKHMGGG